MAIENVIVGLDILVLAAAVAMAYQAHKAHRVLQTQVSLAFAGCFWLISSGLLAHVLSDAGVRTIATQGALLHALSLVGALLLLSGYTLLLLVIERVQSRAMWLITFLLVLCVTVLANNVWGLANLLAMVLLALLAHRFYMNFLRNNSYSSLVIYLSFILLVGAHLAGFLSMFHLSAQVVYLSLSLIAYFALFAVSWRVTR